MERDEMKLVTCNSSMSMYDPVSSWPRHRFDADSKLKRGVKGLKRR